jgi:hypothetical protein
MQEIQLDKTNQAQALTLLPELRPGTLSHFVLSGQQNIRCPGDACYELHIQNWPGGILAKLQLRLSDQFLWLFKAFYWLGHRYVLFAAYVEIRGGTVSRYEYSLGIENGEFPARDVVEVQVLGTNRTSFPGFFGFMSDYDEIGAFRIKMPSNRQTTIMYVAFTPDARQEDAKSAFDVHLECVWNTQGCSATKQLLPLLWARKLGPMRQP